MRKICVVTGSRADYGLFFPLLRKLMASRRTHLRLVVTGMHLSPEFGSTFREIEKDGFKIDERVEMLLSDDTEVGVAKSLGLGVIGFADAFRRVAPDMLVLLGDRFETLAAATAAMVCRIPIAHIHGGETTEGVIDEAIRHAITKMAQMHFTAAEPYRRRVIQLGEDPERVFNVGALGLDNVLGMKLLDKRALGRKLGFQLKKTNFLVTFHPATLEGEAAHGHFGRLLAALDEFQEAGVIFTMPNADAHGRGILRLMDDYVKKNPNRARAYASLGHTLYLSAMKHADAVVGNSSSGIIEAPSFGVPTVNIGSRQEGRLRASSVIDCRPTTQAIAAALRKALSPEFKKIARHTVNPYGQGDAARKILDILCQLPIGSSILKKRFYDVEFPL